MFYNNHFLICFGNCLCLLFIFQQELNSMVLQLQFEKHNSKYSYYYSSTSIQQEGRNQYFFRIRIQVKVFKYELQPSWVPNLKIITHIFFSKQNFIISTTWPGTELVPGILVLVVPTVASLWQVLISNSLYDNSLKLEQTNITNSLKLIQKHILKYTNTWYWWYTEY